MTNDALKARLPSRSDPHTQTLTAAPSSAQLRFVQVTLVDFVEWQNFQEMLRGSRGEMRKDHRVEPEDSPLTCTFCRAAAVVTPIEGTSICATCSRRIGRLAAAGTKDIWAVDSVSRSNPPPSSPAVAEQPSFTKMLRMFQHQVSERIAADDNESHYHLAHAYRAMGLHEDAVRAAGTALDVDPPSVPLVEALVMLLTPPLMKDGGMSVLRMRLAVE